jgi:hypothetical protein
VNAQDESAQDESPQDESPQGEDARGEDARGKLRLAQAALVAALVAGAPLPAGFDSARVAAAARALLRKRAGEVARSWPELARSYGSRWPKDFAGWAAERPPRGSWLDGWDFARAHRAALTPDARAELAGCAARWVYQDGAEPRRRRGMRLERFPSGLVINVAGRTRILRSRRMFVPSPR